MIDFPECTTKMCCWKTNLDRTTVFGGRCKTKLQTAPEAHEIRLAGKVAQLNRDWQGPVVQLVQVVQVVQRAPELGRDCA